jgi:hypothetical protein
MLPTSTFGLTPAAVAGKVRRAFREWKTVEWLAVTLSMYRRVFTRAGVLAGKNWPVMGSVFVYSAVMTVVAVVAALFGPLGGIIVSVVWAACASSFLYLVEMIVRTSKVTLEDFQRSFGAYLWDVVGITFIAWLFFTLATPAIAQLPQGRLVLLFLQIAIFVFFNAVPELIYLGHYSSMALLSESYTFIASNWIEWFPANFLAAVILYVVATVPAAGPLLYLKAALIGLLIYFLMVMRGLLFLELNDSTYRSRLFRYRAGG